jgi:hypothetical protein
MFAREKIYLENWVICQREALVEFSGNSKLKAHCVKCLYCSPSAGLCFPSPSNTTYLAFPVALVTTSSGAFLVLLLHPVKLWLNE